MPRAALGRLPNAPLAYVLAQVQIAAILTMDKLLPDLQAALRATYPRFQALHGLSIVLGAAGAPAQSHGGPALRWDFGNDTNGRGVILQLTSIAYHTAEYTTYEAFSNELVDVLTKAQEAIPDMFVKRIGLRYLDVIIPSAGESPNEFVDSTLRSDPGSLPGVKSHQGMSLINCEMERGRMQVKYYLSGKTTPVETSLIPPDLEPFSLTMPTVIKKAQTKGHPLGILDTDRFIDALDQRYSVNVLTEQFREMHNDISLAFDQFTTDHAYKVWSQA